MGDVPVTGDVPVAGFAPAARALLTPRLAPVAAGEVPGCVEGWVDVPAGCATALACRAPCMTHQQISARESFRILKLQPRI